MNLRELLAEEDVEHRKTLSELKFLELLRERARNSHVVMKHTPIFREDSGADFIFVTPVEKDTRSAFWVDKLIKGFQSWKRFPSRVHFIKGYTSIERVGGADDDHYVVIPLDRARIGVCPDVAFYRSFSKAKEGMGISRVDNDGLGKWIEQVVRSLSELEPDASLEALAPNNYQEFRKQLRALDSVLRGHQADLRKKIKSNESLEPADRKILTDLIDRHVTDAESYLAEKLDPEQNGFSSVRIESFSSVTGDREVWIDDSCLLIKRRKYIEMHEEGTIK